MIVEVEQCTAQLQQERAKLKEAGEGLHIEDLKNQLEEIKEEMNSPGFWEDIEHSTAVNKKRATMENKINHYYSLLQQCEDVETMLELAEEEEDRDLALEAVETLKKLSEDIENLAVETLMRGDYDSCNAVLSLHAGAGGTEAQDWTQMLYRMYTRYCEKKGFKITLLDYLDGDEAGTKSATFEVDGENAYGYLRGEKGVHRLVRISPFDSNARRHTSFSSLDVAPMLEDDDKIEIDMEDVRVDTFRSTGAGGQHVNMTDSAVRMTHMPTGIVVSCQNERSQIQNREMCLKMLRAKLVELKEREKEEQMAEIKGEMKKIEWGSQIRSYIFQPYTMVKDHRTGCETGDIDDVMDGNLDKFIISYLKMQ
jgi:peptide chain release factor 2